MFQLSDVSYRRMVQLSKPGEIRQEYEAELKRVSTCMLVLQFLSLTDWLIDQERWLTKSKQKEENETMHYIYSYTKWLSTPLLSFYG